MRFVLALTVVAAMLAVPASAANVSPIELVLRQIEVPPGYQLDEDNSFAIPNAYLAANPEGRKLIARTGRLGGYYARYTNYGSAASPRWRYVNSAADVFRRRGRGCGVRDLVREAGHKGVHRARQAHFGEHRDDGAGCTAAPIRTMELSSSGDTRASSRR